MPVKKVMKTAMKKKSARRSGYTLFSQDEKDQLRRLQDRGKTPTQVAELMDRDLSSVNRHFQRNTGQLKPAARPVGRPPALTEEQVDKVVKRTEKMIATANGEYQITASMIRTACRLKCKPREVLEALHSRGITAHNLRDKPVLEPEDVVDRLRFANAYKDKPINFWSGEHVHAFLDNKQLPAYLTHRARKFAKKRAVRKTFRGRGQGLGKGHVKPPKASSHQFGFKSVQVSVAISAKKVLCCHVVKGAWNGTAAAKMYTDAVGPALRKAYPSKKVFNLLEDNDPTGYRSKAGLAAKAEAKIKVFNIPKRSPDLNPLDYGFWTAVNRRLRRQESKYGKEKRETRDEFVARLRRTILRMPQKFLTKLVKQMKLRCLALKDAQGGHFEEPPSRSAGSQ